LTTLHQDVLGADGGQYLAILVSDLARTQRAAMQKPFAKHFAIGTHCLGAGCFQVGQLLTFRVETDAAISDPDVEEISGHLFGTIRFLL